VVVETDCKALESFLSREWTNNVMKRVQQEILLEFDVKIVHIPGKENKIADKLSREMCYSSSPCMFQNRFQIERLRQVNHFLPHDGKKDIFMVIFSVKISWTRAS